MTWRELFRRAWLVLRLRFKRFHVCEECGDVMERRESGSMVGTYSYWVCVLCEEFAKLERERIQLEKSKLGVCSVCVCSDCVGATYQRHHAMTNSTASIDPRLLQNAIGAPIRLPAQSAIASAIGQAVGGIIYS